jgi:hypothetical protein
MDRPIGGVPSLLISRGMRTALLLAGLGALGAAGLGLRGRAAAGRPATAIPVQAQKSVASEIRPAANSGLDVGPGQAEPVLVGSP